MSRSPQRPTLDATLTAPSRRSACRSASSRTYPTRRTLPVTALVTAGLAPIPIAAGTGDGYAERSREIRNEFRKWHAEHYGKRVAEVSQGAEIIIGEWGRRN
jgi:hypothetical protein